MENLLYLVELPGKNAEPLVVSCDGMMLKDGAAVFYRNPDVTIAVFAPGRWVSLKLGVAKPKDGAAA